MSDVPVPPIGVLLDIPLPIVELPMPEPIDEVAVSTEGVEGVGVDGLMPLEDGVLVEEDDGMLVEEPVSSTFLPQAPSASKADKATAVRTAGLKFENCMCMSFNVSC